MTSGFLSAMPFVGELDLGAFQRELDGIWESLGYFGPEFSVGLSALALFLLDLVIPLRASRHLAWAALLACILPLGWVPADEERSLFAGMVQVDAFGSFFKRFFLLGAIPVVLLSFLHQGFAGRRMGEYYGILLAAVLGAMLMATSTHFLMVFMSLELLSVCSYVLVGYLRRDRRGAEASLKYIIYGSIAAAIMGYGLSLLYGLTGSADIASLAEVLWVPQHAVYTESAMQLRASTTVTIALLMVFMGFAYKMSSIPMHFWAPDVYEGAPTPVTAFLAILSKAAGFALALRFLSYVPGGHLQGLWAQVPWTELMIALSIITMTFGNLAALWQTNLKRLLAYSSIAHAGYLMMGLAILGSPEGTAEYVGGAQAIGFYLLAYLAMNAGAFAVVLLVENRLGSVDLEAYAGLGRRAPFLALSLAVFLFSLIGVPPTAGFAGKWQLFMGVLNAAAEAGEGPMAKWYYTLAAAAALNTAVSAYYYLRIAREMYMSEAPRSESQPASALGGLVVAAMVFLTFYFFFSADGVLETTSGLKFAAKP
jgi:NADH-quinone oxidoreductase subunit N